MNKIFTIMLVSLLLIAGNAQAHCGKCGVGDADASKADINAMASEKAEKLTKELKLNDEQKTKVQAIIQEKLTKKHEIMTQKHQAMEALQEEFKMKLGAVLSPEQMKSWEAMKKDMDMKGKCPMCKDGMMCEMCKMKKGKMGKMGDMRDHGDHGQADSEDKE